MISSTLYKSLFLNIKLRIIKSLKTYLRLIIVLRNYLLIILIFIIN